MKLPGRRGGYKNERNWSTNSIKNKNESEAAGTIMSSRQVRASALTQNYRSRWAQATSTSRTSDGRATMADQTAKENEDISSALINFEFREIAAAIDFKPALSSKGCGILIAPNLV